MLKGNPSGEEIVTMGLTYRGNTKEVYHLTVGGSTVINNCRVDG